MFFVVQLRITFGSFCGTWAPIYNRFGRLFNFVFASRSFRAKRGKEPKRINWNFLVKNVDAKNKIYLFPNRGNHLKFCCCCPDPKKVTCRTSSTVNFLYFFNNSSKKVISSTIEIPYLRVVKNNSTTTRVYVRAPLAISKMYQNGFKRGKFENE